jgi:hypothetical protein
MRYEVYDSNPNVSGRERKDVTAGDNVKGGDYRRVGRMALSARERKQGHVHFRGENKRDIRLHVNKAHMLRKGGRWIRCHLPNEGIDDVLQRREKNIR